MSKPVLPNQPIRCNPGNTFRYQHPDKGERWIVEHSVPQREQDGSILWHGYIQDITDRKLIEAELSNQEIEIQLIMDATPALISYLDTNRRYLRVNATYVPHKDASGKVKGIWCMSLILKSASRCR